MLEKINSPEDVKKLNIEQKKQLAEEMRKYILEIVSENGGHLASNLGVVELTIALHSVFDVPKDKIVWDVGHQTYVHKIITGRREELKTLRKLNGIAGFPKSKESDADCFNTGHSSTSISAALGMARARDIKGGDNSVLAVIGDGALTGGMALEALNDTGWSKTKMTVILNDNEMSISKNVGALHNHFDKIRSKENYENVKSKTKELMNKIPGIGSKLYRAVKNIKSSIKKLYIKDGFIFEELGIDYYGPINGHDFTELELYLNAAKKSKGPVLIHVITEKGKGYKYAENDREGKWHGVGPFDKNTGIILSNDDEKISWSEVVSDSLIRLMNKDIVVITPAMETGSKLTKFRQMFPNNFIDTGIAEEHALLLANGLSLEGKIPFVSIYSSFLQRGYDQIIHDIARMNSHVIIGIDRSGIVGADGETHQGVFDITFLLPIPNIIIASPKDSVECTNLIKTAIHTKSPFCIRYSKNRINYIKDKPTEIKVGSWEKITDGDDATLITYGDFVNESLEIIEKLKKDKIMLELVNARFIKPIDEEYFQKIINKKKTIFVYEESMKIGSLGSYLSTISEGNIHVFGIEDLFVKQGKREEILKDLELDKDTIYKKMKKIIKKRK